MERVNLNHSSSLALSSQLQPCVAPMTFCPAQQTDRHFDFLEMLDQAVVGCLWPAAEESMRGKMASSRITSLGRSCLRAGECERRSLLGWEHGAHCWIYHIISFLLMFVDRVKHVIVVR